MDSLRSELDTLTELSGQLVSVSGQQETSKLDQVIIDLTTEWQLTTDQCNVSLQQVDSALQQSSVFNEQLAVCTHSTLSPTTFVPSDFMVLYLSNISFFIIICRSV